MMEVVARHGILLIDDSTSFILCLSSIQCYHKDSPYVENPNIAARSWSESRVYEELSFAHTWRERT